ncbi:MAG TPA: glycosyltransferase [Dehalococcoidia bacterium]
MKPDVTVVIPTYNRAGYLERVLRALERQDVPHGTFDVFVVDDGSNDGTDAILSKRYWFDLQWISQPNAGPGAARNAAIERATGELLLFVDDDVIPAENLVRLHLEAQRELRSVVIGRMTEPESQRQPLWAQWETRTLHQQYDKIAAGVFTPSPRQFYTANASVPRDDVRRAGMFDPNFKRAEDVELAYRLADLGLSFRFLSDAVVVHDTPRTLSGWLRVAEQYGRYDIVMWRDCGRRHILDNIAEEFVWYRRKQVKLLTKLSLGRAPIVGAMRAAAATAIGVCDRFNARRTGLAACSAIFTVLYLDAAARELGGRRAFWGAIDEYMTRPEPEVSPATR